MMLGCPNDHSEERRGNSIVSSSSISALFGNVCSVGSDWSAQVACLRSAKSRFEIASGLHHVNCLLETVDRSDRIKYCKPDFESAILHLQKKTEAAFADDILRTIANISKKHFDEYIMCQIPDILMQEIFMMIPLEEFHILPQVCQEWKQLWTSNIIWKTLYVNRFVQLNPMAIPVQSSVSYKSLYEDRVAHPNIGDHIEVSWRGKFRLEADDMYQGLAWWSGVVVACSADSCRDQSEYECNQQWRYKIHYPGWENRWDEWVDRERLRWPIGIRDVTSCSIRKGDTVELWCCGFNVPGVWLESVVKKVKNDQYYVTRAHILGSIWVTRDRIRPKRRKSCPKLNEGVNNAAKLSGCYPSCQIM